jgi:vacuolar-type H+-ATPase subunit I/STV1
MEAANQYVNQLLDPSEIISHGNVANQYTLRIVETKINDLKYFLSTKTDTLESYINLLNDIKQVSKQVDDEEVKVNSLATEIESLTVRIAELSSAELKSKNHLEFLELEERVSALLAEFMTYVDIDVGLATCKFLEYVFKLYARKQSCWIGKTMTSLRRISPICQSCILRSNESLWRLAH